MINLSGYLSKHIRTLVIGFILNNGGKQSSNLKTCTSACTVNSVQISVQLKNTSIFLIKWNALKDSLKKESIKKQNIV